ncbi:type III secretion protein D [Bradyrhizobium yuanmingense]|uniref:Type III secretion protein D n=1 Tax=Bradyrhizobium yuanmingense TaxID=108015 RepID=A0ABV4GLZ9_9BRAD
MNDSVSLEFEVLSGLYTGLKGKAAGGESIVGSGLDADMIFVEQGLEPHHLRIIAQRDSIEVEALAANISIDGLASITSGESVRVPLPAVIHAGAMSIRWSTEDVQPLASSKRSRSSIIALSLVLLSSVVIGTVSIILSPGDRAVVPSTQSSRAVEIATKPTVDHFDPRAADEMALSLRQEIERAGLLDVKIGRGPGVVTAEGTIAPNLVAKWKEIQQWFDRQTNGTTTLVNAVTVKEEKMPSSIAVQGVWRGSEPYLLIAGQKYFVGALLSNGWTVDRIEDGRVLLSRNGRSAALPY